MIKEKVIYVYDGSFEGFLCCIYNFYYNRLKPTDIVPMYEYEPSFYQTVEVETDFEQAYKVKFAIEEQMGYENLNFLRECLLSCRKNKEMHMLYYAVKGFKIGGKIKNMLTDEDVNRLFKAHTHLERERRLYLGIVRFYKSGDVYISCIQPQNRVLPLIAWHFCTRFSTQRFMIYDKTHGQALINSDGENRIVFADDIRLPPPDENELATQKLWKGFYDAIAIKERYNPKCRMSFMPKRVWNNLPEMSTDVLDTPKL